MKSLDISIEPINDRSRIFLSVEVAVEFLIITKRLASVTSCSVCLSEMNIVLCKERLNNRIYICKNRLCRHKTLLLDSLRIGSPKIEMHTYLLAIYKWIENIPEKDILRNLKISKGAFQSIKKHINDFISITNKNENMKLLGNSGLMVQVDETVICHGSLIKSPSQLDDDTPGVTWLVGIIEQGTKDIRLEIVPNRKAETIQALFERNISPGAIVITDGHRSYPLSVKHINGTHIVVNHSKGFKNLEGFHTNNIENLWSLLKYEVKKRRGILKSNITTFLEEFQFRYSKVRIRSKEEVYDTWNEIVDFLVKIKL